MIGILDYGSGNLFSISNALKKINLEQKFVKNIEDFDDIETLILPGVGSFKECIDKLKKKNFYDHLQKFVKSNKKLVGICLGMQMLFEKSEEDGLCEGLGLIEGNVKYIKNIIENDNDLPIPNMGWFKIYTEGKKEDKLFKNIKNMEFYFAHSLVCEIKNKRFQIAFSKFDDLKFCSVVKKKNIFGIQFHPEKSGEEGLKLFKNILNYE